MLILAACARVGIDLVLAAKLRGLLLALATLLLTSTVAWEQLEIAPAVVDLPMLYLATDFGLISSFTAKRA